MSDHTAEQELDSQVDKAIVRRIAHWVGRLPRIVKALLVVLPIAAGGVAGGTALSSAPDVPVETIKAYGVAIQAHETAINAVSARTGVLESRVGTVEGAQRASDVRYERILVVLESLQRGLGRVEGALGLPKKDKP